jgi:hypothetical protein
MYAWCWDSGFDGCSDAIRDLMVPDPRIIVLLALLKAMPPVVRVDALEELKLMSALIASRVKQIRPQIPRLLQVFLVVLAIAGLVEAINDPTGRPRLE